LGDDAPDFFVSRCLPDWEHPPSRYLFVRSITANRACSISLYRDQETGRECVGKRMFIDPPRRIYLLRELEVLISAKHSTLIRFVGFSLLRESHSFALLLLTDYYPNGSIADYCAAHVPSNTEKMIWIFGIAVGMAYLHSRRVQHRDLKPANVFLDLRLRPLIGDFGSSKDFSVADSMLQSKEVGTPCYTAPEIFSEGYGSWEVDVFAYAMTVYEIVTGTRPFADIRSPANIMFKVVSGVRPMLPESVPRQLRSLIMTCWSQNPNDRLLFPAIVNFLIESGPLLPDVDRSVYKAYIDEISSQKLTFVAGLRKASHSFNLLDSVSVLRQWVIQHYHLRYPELEYNGAIISDSDPFLAFSFDPSISIVVRSRHLFYASSLPDANAGAVEVQIGLPLGDLVPIQVDRTATIGDVLDRMETNSAIADLPGHRRLVILGTDGKRLERHERVWGLHMPLTAAKPMAILSIVNRQERSIAIDFPCLANDTVDHLRDFLTYARGPTDQRLLVLLDDSEPAGSDRLLRLAGTESHWFFDYAPSSADLSFTVSFDPQRPVAGGVVRRLRELESRFDRFVILSQSTNTVSRIIDPGSNDCYVSHGRGGAVVELFFANEITLNGMAIQFGSQGIPRIISIGAVGANGDWIPLSDIAPAEQPRPLSSTKVDFDPVTARVFRVSQVGPPWSERPIIRIQKIECFSPDPRFAGGVFANLFRGTPEAVAGFVEITARFNQPDQLYRLDGTFNCCTRINCPPRPWVEVCLRRGRLAITGYALKRRVGLELRSWSVLASNNGSLPLEQWTPLHQVTDLVPSEGNAIEFFPIRANFQFSHIRLVNEGERWDHKQNLHIDGFELYGSHDSCLT
jgi:serine/threonine protein kinase